MHKFPASFPGTSITAALWAVAGWSLLIHTLIRGLTGRSGSFHLCSSSHPYRALAPGDPKLLHVVAGDGGVVQGPYGAVLAGKYRVPGGSRGCVVDHFLLAGLDHLSSLSLETADRQHQMPPGI